MVLPYVPCAQKNRSQGFISSLLLSPQKAHGEIRLCRELVGIELSPEHNREKTDKNFLHVTWDHHLNCTQQQTGITLSSFTHKQTLLWKALFLNYKDESIIFHRKRYNSFAGPQCFNVYSKKAFLLQCGSFVQKHPRKCNCRTACHISRSWPFHRNTEQ